MRPRWSDLFPPLHWLPAYQAGWLRYDLLAGVTLAAYAVPVAMAYASLAGVPPVNGIYGYLLGGLAYAAFGSSRQLAIGPTSAISMLVGTTVATMAGGDPVRWAQIAALTALVLAAVAVLSWLLRLSNLVVFISETVLLGFKAGAALTIAMTQLPKLFGVAGGGEHFFARVWTLVGQLGDTNVAVLAFGLVAIALLLAGEKWLPGRPAALVVVVLAIVAMTFTSLAQSGFATVGELPRGLPVIERPPLGFRDVDGVVTLAAACFLLAYIEGVSAARTLAAGHGQTIDPRQELLALGAANFAAAMGHAYPVAGGLSQSAVNDKAGARTPLALVVASVTLGLCLLFLTGLLRNLPTVVLASIVLVAVKGLIKVKDLRELWRVSRFEFTIAMSAVVGVLLLGILRGVLLAAIISMLMLIRRVTLARVAPLGRIPGWQGSPPTGRYSDMERHPDNEPVAGVLIVRVESAVLYFNLEHVREQLDARIAASAGLRAVVWDLSSTPYVDTAAARMIADLHRDLAARGIALRLVEARAGVRDLLRGMGLEERVGRIGRFAFVDDVVRELEAGAAAR